MSLADKVAAQLATQKEVKLSVEETLNQMQQRAEAALAARPKLGRKEVDGEFTIPSTGKRSRATRVVATWDVETNPFDNVNQELIVPFIWDYYDGNSHTTYSNRWEDWRHLIQKFFDELSAKQEPQIVFAHNGGKFDFTFLAPYFDKQKLLIINGRLVSAWMGKHQFRDSYAMLPVKLAEMEKEKFDYELLRENTRWDNLDAITRYLRSDTENLYRFVAAWLDTFGNKVLTMASAAMAKLNDMYEYRKLDKHSDCDLRRYYFGGRVECFQSNEIIRDSINVYDVNSMYPYVMANSEHPIGDTFFTKQKVDIYDPEFFFATVEADSKGALPVRDKEGLHFPHGRNVFQATCHELRAGVETGCLSIHRIINPRYSLDFCNFSDFIELYYDLRMAAKARKDEMYTLFWKLVMNSTYGKFAQNPDKFREQHIVALLQPISDIHNALGSPVILESVISAGFELDEWKLKIITPKYVVIERNVANHQQERGYRNVATAASITGAARAMLLRGIACAKGLIYCDTDSLMCESLAVEMNDTKLGAWKHEATGTHAYVVGKKTYALFDGNQPVKSASKGVRLTPEQIRGIALRGEECEFVSTAPSFKLSGEQQYIRRRIRNTVNSVGTRKPARVKEVKRSLYQ